MPKVIHTTANIANTGLIRGAITVALIATIEIRLNATTRRAATRLKAAPRYRSEDLIYER